MTSLLTRLVRGAALLRDWRDVLEERVADDAAPAWAVRRGWDDFLLALTDEDLARCERDGGPAVASLAGAPADLVALGKDVIAAGTVRDASDGARASEALHGAPLRKSGQVGALVELCRERGFAPRRVVDVGAGAGHLTRALARALGVPAVGLERDADRVARARARSSAGDDAAFEAVAVAPASLSLAKGDLAVGLHACGALGDALVEVAARDEVDLVLVACCPQKVPGAQRAALSRSGREHELTIARELLGLANSHEGSLDVDARSVRVALRSLLRARGVVVRAGEETRGLTPRTARTLPVAAERVLSRRGLPLASASEQEEALAAARVALAVARRRSLPRRLLAPALEVTLALDRARALEEAGATAEVLRLFPRALSPRNLAVVARGCHGGRP